MNITFILISVFILIYLTTPRHRRRNILKNPILLVALGLIVVSIFFPEMFDSFGFGLPASSFSPLTTVDIDYENMTTEDIMGTIPGDYDELYETIKTDDSFFTNYSVNDLDIYNINLDGNGLND